MKQQLLFLLFLVLPAVLVAQQRPFNGTVFGRIDGKLQPMENALVAAPASGTAIYTDADGRYELTLQPNDEIVVVSFMGFVADTVKTAGLHSYDFTLDQAFNLREVTITGKRDETFISTINQHKTEVITTEGLQQNACCNLAEAFESNPSVDATVSDAVTGAKQIQMLGLSGVYVQLQTDMLPGIRGLNVLTGLNDIPGPFIEAIHIRKGPGSVANGYEAITGQIDVEMVKPLKSDKLFVNGYADSESRLELNAFVRTDAGKWSGLTMLHGSQMTVASDLNGDGFFDRPMFKRLNAVHRWQHISPKGKNSEIGFRVNLNEEDGGNVETRLTELAAFAYHIDQSYNRQEVFGKTCLALSASGANEVGLQFHAARHDRSMQFGHNRLHAAELTGYANVVTQVLSPNTKHIYRFGPSLFVSRYHETMLHHHPAYTEPEIGIEGVLYDASRDEAVPGVFAEYTYDNQKRLSVIAGLRADYAPDKTIMPTPRLHVRYKLTDNLVARASAGTGWRMAHPLTEHVAYFISSRKVVFESDAKPEHAANYGVNLTHHYKVANRPGEWSFDAYRTDFFEQTVVNLERSPYEVHIENLNGSSYSNSLQLQVKQELVRNLTVLVGAKYNDTRTTYDGVLRQRPFSPLWRGLANASYGIWGNRIKLDATLQYVGEQRLPNLVGKVAHAEHSSTSPSFTRLLGQVTYQTKRFEVYVGGENLTNFMQHNPIIGAADPYGPDFDAAMVWGPTMGAMIYTGFRFKILNK